MKRYCVIAPSLTGGDRTWMETEDQAVGRAIELMAKPHNPPDKLYVVEIRKVVKRANPPVEVIDPD